MEEKIWRAPQAVSSLDEAETPLWFWNDRLENKELLRQLALQTQAGIKCTTPHARTNQGEGFLGGYLDEEWFDHIRTVTDYKKQHGEPMWLYDEIDWPAGSCNKTITKDENNREQYLTVESTVIPAGQPYRSQLKTFEGKLLFGITPGTDCSSMALNITILDAATGEPYPLPPYFRFGMFGPELEFHSDREAIAYQTNIRVDRYEQGGDEQVNYLDRSVTEKFIAAAYEPYEKHCGEDFGKTIRCVFNDECRMCNPLPWSKDFAREFEIRKGYDLRPHAYQLVLPGEAAGRVRCDYFDVVAALFQQNYYGVLHNWCAAHHLQFFAHLLGEETMFGHARYSGDYLRQNRNQDVCGADHLGKGIGSLNIKYTACGAHSYGKKRTAVEVFAGCGWDLTFQEYCRIVTWMFQQGMQGILNHGFFYSDRGRRKNDWPPSQFFQWQGWPQMPAGNAMIRRLAYAMTDGVNEADVLVYHPMESFWLHYLPDQHFTHAFFHGPYLADAQAATIDQGMQRLLGGLMAKNLDFDLIHKDALENFTVKGGKICNLRSGQQFSVLLLPFCEVLPLPMMALAAQFAEAGGQILAIGGLPRLALRPEEDGALQQLTARLSQAGQLPCLPAEENETIYQFVEAHIPLPVQITGGIAGTVNNYPVYPAELIDPYLHTGEDITGVQFVRYLKDGCRNTLFMNYGNAPETIEVSLEAPAAPPTLWDTMSGEITTPTVLQAESGRYTVQLTLPCDHGVVLVSRLSAAAGKEQNDD